MEQKNNSQQTGQQDGAGRTFNQSGQEHERHNSDSDNADISSIDQQEGMMEHGETGGSGHLTPKDKGDEGAA